tara:strand:- start:276 stop:485 length:210 start_codon:yes stop_codon:yes gene_type:complete
MKKMLGLILLLISIHLCNGIWNYTNNVINSVDFVFLDDVLIIKNREIIYQPTLVWAMKKNENNTFIQLL